MGGGRQSHFFFEGMEMLVRVVWVNYSEVTQFNMVMELRFQCFDRKQHNTYLLIATNYVSQLGHVSSLDARTYVFLNVVIIDRKSVV